MRNQRRIVDFGAIGSGAISGLVLLSWAVLPERLQAAWPMIFEMKVNSALGFGAAGVGLLFLARERPRTAITLALIPLLIGSLTLLEYGFGARLPIDELLLRDWSTAAGGLPGRPPPNTATILVAIAVALITLARGRAGRLSNLIVMIICLAIIAVAMEAAAGHIGNSSFAVSWGTPQRMSVPSTLCGLALGAGLLAFLWQSETSVIARLPVWVPALLCFGIILLDVSNPPEINAGISYVLLVLCGLWFSRPNVAIILAGISTLLIIFGFYASPPAHIPIWILIFNRGRAIIAVWVAAAIVYRQHTAERKLRRSERHLTSAQRIAAIGSFELEFAGMTFKSSDTFDSLHGLDADHDHGWGMFVRKAIPPDERGGIDRTIRAAQDGMQSGHLEYSFLRADGVARNAVLHCELLYDAAGAPAGIIGVVHDVTELRQAQAHHNDIESQLRHAQKLEALGMVAGGIAHDLNNTLMPITTLAPFVLETATEPSARQSLEIIIDAGRRAKELVREMLVFSRKDGPVREVIRLDLLARETLMIVRAGIPASIAIVDALDPVPEIVGNRGQIYQIILNLATNAAHAIGDRAGTITIGSTCTRDPLDRGTDLRLYVADDGAGMDEKTQKRIFEPFFSTKDKREGSGLGLSIVSGIMKSHGGSIDVQSERGKGTRFDLLFPAIEAVAAA